jgi:hypothetical protein
VRSRGHNARLAAGSRRNDASSICGSASVPAARTNARHKGSTFAADAAALLRGFPPASALRGSVEAKRALWPLLRRLRRSSNAE